MLRIATTLIVAALFVPRLVTAQEHSHGAPAAPAAAAAAAGPTQSGQDAYGAIAEIVALLEADSTTDWTKVDLEALRRHLIDMNAVTLRSVVHATPVPGGLAMTITGQGQVAAAVRRMVGAHGPVLDAMPEYAASVSEITGGVRLVVRAERAGDVGTERRIRGLGFIGLLTVGAHHAPHHLALAQGLPMAGHAH